MRQKIELLPDDDDTCGWVRLLPARKNVQRVAGRRSFDWVVVGAGYAGLAAARRLAEHQPEKAIAVIDAQRAGEGAAGRNSGFAVEISPSPNPNVVSPQATYGRSIRINRFGQDLLRQLVTKHAIACDWRESGKYQSAAEEHHFGRLDAFARHLEVLGIPHEVLGKEELAARLGTKHYRRAVHTKQTVLVQPAALTRGLALSLPANVTLLEESPVLEFETGSGITLTCPSGTVTADRLILATNSYLPQFGAWRNQLISFTLTAALSRPLTEEEDLAVVERINATSPDIVWVGLGTPKQEQWMAAHVGRVNAPVLVGVGAAFDFHAGAKPQAPVWMQRSGLEWVFRLATEPRRLWRRYFYHNPRFILSVFLQMSGLRTYSIQT